MRLKEKKETLDHKKISLKQVEKVSKSKEDDENKISIESSLDFKETKINKTDKNEENAVLDKNNELELTDEINNARKKRRRSSASIE